jgi:hypothetical protein
VLEYMHSSIITEIEKLEHMVTNIWNIKQYRTKLSLLMFFVELKPAPNNKYIYNVLYEYNSFFFFLNPLLFASCTNTFSKCCEITTTTDMKRSAQ